MFMPSVSKRWNAWLLLSISGELQISDLLQCFNALVLRSNEGLDVAMLQALWLPR